MVSTDTTYTYIIGLLFTVASNSNSYWMGNWNDTAMWALDSGEGNEWSLSYVSGLASSTQLYGLGFTFNLVPPAGESEEKQDTRSKKSEEKQETPRRFQKPRARKPRGKRASGGSNPSDDKIQTIGIFGGPGGTPFSDSAFTAPITKILGYEDKDGNLIGIQFAYSGKASPVRGTQSEYCTEFNIAQNDYITNVMVSTNTSYTQIVGLLFTVASKENSYWMGNCNITAAWAIGDGGIGGIANNGWSLSYISGFSSSMLSGVAFNWIKSQSKNKQTK